MFRTLARILSPIAVLSWLAGCSGSIERRGAADSGDGQDGGGSDVVGTGGTGGAPADASDGAVDAPSCRRTPGRIGPFLMTMSLKPFPAKPNLLHATIELLANQSMQLTLQHYDYNRVNLVGAPFTTGPIPLRADGSFSTDKLVLELPGLANCALPDTAVTNEVTLQGRAICDDTVFACGSFGGVVLGLGVDLNGSTFTLQKIENGVIPAPVLNCQRSGVVEPCK